MVRVESKLLDAIKDAHLNNISRDTLAYHIGESLAEVYHIGGTPFVKTLITKYSYFVKEAVETNEIMQGMYEKAEELGYYNDKLNSVIAEISATYQECAA